MWIQSLAPLEDLLSLTASEEVATFEVSNLQTPLPTTVWRSTGLTPFIVGNFVSSINVDNFAAWYTNAQIGDENRLRLANSEAALTAAPLIDITVDVIPGTPTALYISRFIANFFYIHQRQLVTPTAATWFRIDFDYTGNSDGFVQVGSLPIGERLNLQGVNNDGDTYRELFNRTTDPRAGFDSRLAGGGLSLGQYVGKRPWDGIVTTTKNEWLDDIQPLLDSRLNGPVSMVLEEAEVLRPLDYMFFGYLRGVASTSRTLHQVSITVTEP